VISRISKLKLTMTDVQEIEIERDAKILSVQTQNHAPYIWYIFDNRNADTSVKRKLHMFETDALFYSDEKYQYIGTFQTTDGTAEYHLFEDVWAY
jgi:hypothetical protein